MSILMREKVSFVFDRRSDKAGMSMILGWNKAEVVMHLGRVNQCFIFLRDIPCIIFLRDIPCIFLMARHRFTTLKVLYKDSQSKKNI